MGPPIHSGSNCFGYSRNPLNSSLFFLAFSLKLCGFVHVVRAFVHKFHRSFQWRKTLSWARNEKIRILAMKRKKSHFQTAVFGNSGTFSNFSVDIWKALKYLSFQTKTRKWERDKINHDQWAILPPAEKWQRMSREKICCKTNWEWEGRK